MKQTLSSMAWCLIAGTLLFLGTSCKKTATDFGGSDELIRLNAYRNLHYPESRRLTGDAFVQTLKPNADGASLATGGWLYFDYWATDLDGTLLATSLSNKAKEYGQYTSTSYYTPRYKALTANGVGTTLSEALNTAHIGEELVVGLPASQAQALSLWKNANYHSALLYLIPRQLVSDPKAHEKELIDAYMSSHPGFEAADKVYRKIETAGTGAEIKSSSTVWVQYAIYSLSGYLFDTNIAETAQQHGRYSSSSNKYGLLSMKATEDKKLITGFSGLTVGLKTGTKLRAIIPSEVGYGESGRGEIRPNEPLLVELNIVRSSN